MHDDSDSSEVDEEQLARERAAIREAMGAPPTVPPTFPILSRPAEVQGDAGAVASGGGGSGADDGEDDDDDSDDSATIAQERAALQRAMGAGGSELGFSTMASPAQPPFTRGSSHSSPAWSAPFARGPARDLGLQAPSTPAAGDANRQDALALQRALMVNLKYQQVCHATRNNIRSKRIAKKALEEGIPLLIFPSGFVSTADRFGLGHVEEAPWTTFAAKMIRDAKATVVPVYFEGQNSRIFHVASHFSEALRSLALLNEVTKRFNKPVFTTIGEPLLWEKLEPIADRKTLTQFLYYEVQKLKPQ